MVDENHGPFMLFGNHFLESGKLNQHKKTHNELFRRCHFQ